MNLKDAFTETFLKAAEQTASSENIKKFKSLWWFSYRSKNEGGLRLTEEGLNFIVEHAKIKTYKIEFPKELKITPQVLVYLDNFINCPFYIDKKYITVLSEKAAFELYLFSGDVRKLGAGKALHKRLNQIQSQS
jgi:hypothetical protein